VILVLAVLATFGRTITHDFVQWDDQGHVTENPRLDPISSANLIRFWREPYFGHYVPVSYMVFAAEAWLAQSSHDAYGQRQFDPALFHAVSVGLHLACVLLAYRFLKMLVGQPWSACLGACLFAVHPLQVESVAWISEQRGLLASLFSFLSLMAYVRFGSGVPQSASTPAFHVPLAEQAARKLGWYLLATTAYALALLAKPSAVAVPLLAVVLDRLLLRRSTRVTLLGMIPWLALAAGLMIVTKQQQPDEQMAIVAHWWLRPLIAGDALQFYLAKVLWPAKLAIQYPHSVRTVMESSWVYGAWLIPAIVLGLCVRYREQGPWLLGAGWFVAALAPVLGLVPFGYQHFSTVADRYVYLALFAPALVLAWWIQQHHHRRTITIAWGLLVALGAVSFRQAGYWRNSETLFTRTLEVNPRSQVAHGGLGAELMRYGRFAESLPHLEENIRLSGQAVAERDYLNRARALLGLNRVDEAIQAYQHTLKMFPGSVAGHQNLAAAYFQNQDWSRAIEHSRQALAAAPENIIAHFNLALSLEKAGHDDAAIEQFRALLAQRPAHHPARLKLGMQLARRGQRGEAISHFRFILSQQDDPSAHAELAAALWDEGDTAAAESHYRLALSQDSPYWASIAGRLAWHLATHPRAEVRKGQQALKLAEEACRLTRFEVPALVQSLAAAQAEVGRFDEALASARQAAELASRSGQSTRVREIEAQLSEYAQGRPYYTSRSNR
jgi:tetratricopeptide (TPR) repeat protein